MKFKCKTCDGSGAIEQYEPFAGRWQDDQGWSRLICCPDCDGTGEASDSALKAFWDEYKNYPADHLPAFLAHIMAGVHSPAFERAMALDFNN